MIYTGLRTLHNEKVCRIRAGIFRGFHPRGGRRPCGLATAGCCPRQMAIACGQRDRFHPVVRAEHAVDPDEAHLHRTHGQPEPPRDRLGGVLLGQQVEHRDLPRVEMHRQVRSLRLAIACTDTSSADTDSSHTISAAHQRAGDAETGAWGTDARCCRHLPIRGTSCRRAPSPGGSCRI